MLQNSPVPLDNRLGRLGLSETRGRRVLRPGRDLGDPRPRRKDHLLRHGDRLGQVLVAEAALVLHVPAPGEEPVARGEGEAVLGPGRDVDDRQPALDEERHDLGAVRVEEAAHLPAGELLVAKRVDCPVRGEEERRGEPSRALFHADPFDRGNELKEKKRKKAKIILIHSIDYKCENRKKLQELRGDIGAI